jgi:CHAD domain-containing protein
MAMLDIELTLPPDAAGRVTRLRQLAALKTGRARNHPIRIVWHDTPKGDLLRSGRALAEQRGHWRLEQVGAIGPGWPPGAPSPVLAEAESADTLDPPPPAPLVPVAAFEGRAITLDLLREGEAVTLRVLDGVMRGVTAERRAARAVILGPEAAALALAALLAQDVGAAIPAAALGAAALAAAQASEPSARRLGPPALPPELSVGDAFAHVAGHLTDVMLHWGGQIAAESPELMPVHQMRVAMRRLRSALSLFAEAADPEALADIKEHLRGLAAVLGPARDWDVFCSQTGSAVGEAFAPEAQVKRLLTAAERLRGGHYQALRGHLRGPAYRVAMLRLAALPRRRDWIEQAPPELAAALTERLAGPLPEFAAAKLDKRRKRMLQAGDDIEHLEPGALHEIRLLAKRMRYAAEFFAELWPGKAPRRFIRRLTVLQEALGVLNDGAVAAQLMAELGGSGADRAFAIGVVRGFVAGRGGAHRSEIAAAWRKFRRAQPFWE